PARQGPDRLEPQDEILRRASPHDRLVLLDQGPGSRARLLQPHADGAGREQAGTGGRGQVVGEVLMAKRPVVSVIGLGKLGAGIAACFAHKGFSVIGADVSAKTVEQINQQKPPVTEPQLTEMMAGLEGRLRATDDVAEAVIASDLTLLVVPTPSTAEGGLSIDSVVEAARSIGPGLKPTKRDHLVRVTRAALHGST